ncbi:MAG TPA: hypothetical protein VLB46_06045 [Pyrinomonadaceae bacterium]|nr:hypothetical protein [Pyrinomonadaceae bacterium]
MSLANEPASVTWKGRFHDVNGFEGKLELRITGSDGDVTGQYSLSIRDEEEQFEAEGEITGTIFGSEVKLTLHHVGADADIQLEGQSVPSKGYAKRSMFGRMMPARYHNFGGGIWIAWQFEDSTTGGGGSHG